MTPHILSFGEVLWDIFGDKKTIGGAPLNFAAHAAKLGADVTFVSAVGDDALGKDTLAAVSALGLSTDAVAVLPGVPTGHCIVTLQNGTPRYALARGVAYDRIPMPALPEKQVNALCLGTLASRDEISRATRDRLLRELHPDEVFFDINIRGNDWSEADLAAVLPFATLLKFSREEKYAFASYGDTPEEICLSLSETYPGLKQIVVTLDKDGAMSFDPKKKAFLHSPKPKNKPVSTVGAGDSFSACWLYNYLCGAEPRKCLARAVTLSDFVVTELGAVPAYPDGLKDAVTE